MIKISIYLNFDGNCEEAFGFYKSVFGGEYTNISKYKDMPQMEGMQLAEKDKEKLLHVSLPISKETVLMGADAVAGMGAPLKTGNNFSISIGVESKTEADKYFNALGVGGQVVMPMGMTFWDSYFGMLTDKFGINWMISFEEVK